MDGALSAGVEIFGMVIVLLIILAGVLMIAGFVCWLGAASIRFAVRQLRTRGFQSLGRHTEEMKCSTN